MRATAWYCVLIISQQYMISCLNAEGSVLDIEPSMMRGVFIEGSGLRNGTFHDFGLQRGRFRSGGWTFHDAGRFRGGFGSAEWNLPRFRASAWKVPPNSLFRPTASRKHQRAGILPQVVVDRVCGQSARARIRTDACGQKTGQAMHLIACLRPKDGRDCKSPLQRPAASIK